MIAELIGDMTKLLHRIDTLAPAIDSSGRAMRETAHELAASVERFRVDMDEIALQTKQTSVRNILTCTREAAAVLLEAQTRAMSASARAMFDNEVAPPLRGLAWTLEQLVAQTRRPWWSDWVGYAATAITSGIWSAALVLYLLHR